MSKKCGKKDIYIPEVSNAVAAVAVVAAVVVVVVVAVVLGHVTLRHGS